MRYDEKLDAQAPTIGAGVGSDRDEYGVSGRGIELRERGGTGPPLSRAQSWADSPAPSVVVSTSPLLLLSRGSSSQLSLLLLDGCLSTRSTSDSSSLSLLFLHPLHLLRLLPCRQSNVTVFSLQQQVGWGVLEFYFGNGPVGVCRGTPFGVGVQEGVRMQVQVERRKTGSPDSP